MALPDADKHRRTFNIPKSEASNVFITYRGESVEVVSSYHRYFGFLFSGPHFSLTPTLEARGIRIYHPRKAMFSASVPGHSRRSDSLTHWSHLPSCMGVRFADHSLGEYTINWIERVLVTMLSKHLHAKREIPLPYGRAAPPLKLSVLQN